MNEIRHVMLPKLDDPPKVAKHQPWYKERLKEKYLSNKKNPNHKEKILDSKQWVFVKDGLDDFRDGKAPPHDDILIKPLKGPGPNVKHEKRIYKQSVLPPVQRYTTEQRCYSRMLPLVQAKRERINQLIYGLTQHPLALYSHLEEALPADLFEEIVDLLDPDMNHMNSVAADTPDINANEKSHSALTSQSFRTRDSSGITQQKTTRDERKRSPSDFDRSTLTSATMTVPETEKRHVRNTYKWLLRKEEAKANAKGPDSEELKAQAIDNHIKHVTEEFCNWIKSLGGEHNIDPVTLTSLFASGYETKPALSVPIHVVELTNIPPELRDTATAATSNNENNQEEYFEENDTEVQDYKLNRYRFGAWYLPKKLWRKMPVDEKLVDPKLAIDKEKEEAKKKVEEMNSKLAPLHGTQSFKEFAKSKNLSRLPKMLDEIDQWQNEELIKSSLLEADKDKEPSEISQ